MTAMPTLIDQAYARMGRAFAILRQFRKIQSGALPAAVSLFTLPTDCIFVRDFEVLGPDGTSTILEMREFDSLRSMYSNVNDTGEPRFFAEYSDTQLFLGPTPNQSYNYNFIYARRLPSLSVANPSDWISTNAQDALLSSVCLEGALFKQDPALKDYWEKLFLAARQAVIAEYITTQRSDYRVNTTQTFNMGTPEMNLANGPVTQ